ncbi:MAG: MerR family transcriptional regulator [Syntrophobacterales bacterium]|jgi:DNA-binding transcriptional MerR regulator|nr:MerR family transcriptional regulator [Syntrophobacterales bacterium]
MEPIKETFGKKTVEALTELTYRQIDYWATTGVVIPSVPAAGKGSRREYSFKDLVALRVAKKLKKDGISLQKIRKALDWLRKQDEFKDLRQPLAELRFVTDGETLFVTDLERDREKIIDALKQGQLVFSVALGKIIEDLHGEIRRLARSRETKVWVGNRPFTVVLTPDLEDGGFTVQCKEEPAAISHGATEQEAVGNIIDALELCLEHEKELQAANAGESQAI